MSQDAGRANEQAAGPAMVRKRTGHIYCPEPYMGTQREPRRADEIGARCVVDLLFGGRVLLFDREGDYLRVQYKQEEAQWKRS